MKGAIKAVFLLVLATSLASAEDQSSSKHELVFGVLPIISTEKLVANFGPMVDGMSEALGVPVRMETAPNYAEFVRRTNDEKRYDILFTAPHFYYLAHRRAGYHVIARIAVPTMHAIIVAPKQSNIHTLADLRGKQLSVPDSLSLGTILVRHMLREAGLDIAHDLKLVETPSHNASLLSAYKGITDAAGLMVPPFRRADSKIRNAMRILEKSKGTPHMPFSVSDNLPQNQAMAVQHYLLQLDKNEAGRKILKKLTWPGLTKAKEEEYSTLEWVMTELDI